MTTVGFALLTPEDFRSATDFANWPVASFSTFVISLAFLLKAVGNVLDARIPIGLVIAIMHFVGIVLCRKVAAGAYFLAALPIVGTDRWYPGHRCLIGS
ncbi:hypothetical protein ASE04_19085 [Rhizobium sp. Root708]|nr:hypothetical protein ASE04_19085 [Rhizobium sp. Root708]